MNRYYVETPYTQGKEPMKIYAKTLEDVQSKFPEAISITPCDDKSHLQYIKDITSRSKLVNIKLNQKRNYVIEFYRYDGGSFILYIKLYKDYDDNKYFDYCEYKEIRDDGNLFVHIGWMVSDIKEAYDRYFYSVPHKDIGYTVTPKEIKKNKYKKWYNKDGEYGWVDTDGYFYFADKISMPNKKNKEEYAYFTQYKDTAILVTYKLFTWADYGTEHTEWFANKQDFDDFWNMMIVECPDCCQTPWYKIVKHGYKKLPPDDRKVILRMPYINVEAELKEKPYAEVAHMWERLCLPMREFKHYNGLHIWLEKIVKAYKEYLEKE